MGTFRFRRCASEFCILALSAVFAEAIRGGSPADFFLDTLTSLTLIPEFPIFAANVLREPSAIHELNSRQTSAVSYSFSFRNPLGSGLLQRRESQVG